MHAFCLCLCEEREDLHAQHRRTAFFYALTASPFSLPAASLSLLCAELKEMCKERELSTAGKKSELIKRLVSDACVSLCSADLCFACFRAAAYIAREK